MTWNLVNVSREPQERLFYYLDGDAARAFQDLNIIVLDEEDRELEIMSVNVNKPFHKEFFVKFRRPLKPGEKGRLARIEYDWEEPERNFFYRFATDCKRFDFSLEVPAGFEVHQKVLKVDTESGEKYLTSTFPIVKYHDDKTVITWSGKNFRAHEAYRFDW